MPLDPKIVTRGLVLLSRAGFGRTPEIDADLVKTWSMTLGILNASGDDWLQCVQRLLVERGRKFWPSTAEAADVIREVQREGRVDMVAIGVRDGNVLRLEFKTASEREAELEQQEAAELGGERVPMSALENLLAGRGGA